MGWSNPPIPWSELERRLSDRRRPGAPVDADGGDSPAWSHKRQPYQPSEPVPAPPATGRALRRTARALQLQLPRRRQLTRTAPRGGRPAGPPRARPDRPRRLLRRRAPGRGRGELRSVKTVFGAELSLGLGAPQNGVADPEGSHLLVLARREEGYHRLASALTRRAAAPARRRANPPTTSSELAEQAGGHWTILSGCRKGAVRHVPCARRGPAAAAAELDRLVALFGAEQRRTSNCSTTATPQDSSHNDALARLAAERRPPAGRHGQRALREPGRAPAGRGARGRARPAQPRRDGRLAAAPGAGRTCAAAPRWRPGSAGSPAPSRTPCRWPTSWPSRCAGRAPGCRSRRCPTGTPR